MKSNLFSLLVLAVTLLSVAAKPESGSRFRAASKGTTPLPETPSPVAVSAAAVATPKPTLKPSPKPTLKSTPKPTLKSTPKPTLKPTRAPTRAPTRTITPAPTPQPTTVSATTSHCGCATCTDQFWNADADGFTCGARILWVLGSNPEAYPTEAAACARVAGTEFPQVCGPACDPARCSSTSATPSPTPTPAVATPPPTSGSVHHCGCQTCTSAMWNTDADGFTCGARVEWLMANYPETYRTESSACATVAGNEFPTICGPACDPNRCSNASPTTTPAPVQTSGVTPSPIVTPAPNNAAPTSDALYCYPSYADRTRYTNVWSKYILEVKESSSVCGPGNNIFSTNTVSLSGDTLTMSYKKVGSTWEASEVRVLLPNQKFTYGTYSFSVKSVSVIDTTDSSIVSNALPESLVLGLFTWDDTDDYATHENWNHEVDIEISRWNNPTDADVQFLVQPVEAPSRYRFFSGASSTLDPGGHQYAFAWNPGKIDWSTTAGGQVTHTYSTATSVANGVQDYIQCLPANMEVRINLWNSIGAVAPTGLADNYKVEVKIDNFTFTPSGLTSVANDGACAKDCMCATSSRCVNGVCVATR